MVQTAPNSASAARRKLLLQLVTFSAIVLLVVLQPRIEAWISSQSSAAASSEMNTGTAGAGAATTGESSASEPEPVDEVSNTAANSGSLSSQDSSFASEAEVTEIQVEANGDQSVTEKKPSVQDSKSDKPKSDKASSDTAKSQKKSEKKSDIVRMERPQTKTRQLPGDSERSNPPPDSGKNESSRSELGKLREIENNVFQSTAGLIYIPGSADGHRLRHVMQHAKDNPQKEVHGVFDGDRDEILAVIDEAWTKVKKGGSDVRSQKQNDRRVVTVNLKRRIGQVGGRQGERQGNPECRYLRIVLENENEVISAYPTKSF